MRAMWSNNTGVPGPAIESKKFFAGIEVSVGPYNIMRIYTLHWLSIPSQIKHKCNTNSSRHIFGDLFTDYRNIDSKGILISVKYMEF